MRATTTRFLSGLSTVGLAVLLSSVPSRLVLDTGSAVDVAAGPADQGIRSRCRGFRYASVAQSGTRGAFIGAILGGPQGALAGAGVASIATGVHQAWSMTSCLRDDANSVASAPLRTGQVI